MQFQNTFYATDHNGRLFSGEGLYFADLAFLTELYIYVFELCRKRLSACSSLSPGGIFSPLCFEVQQLRKSVYEPVFVVFLYSF